MGGTFTDCVVVDGRGCMRSTRSRRFIDPLPQFRQFFCQSCRALIENEIGVSDEPPLRDVELRLR